MDLLQETLKIEKFRKKKNRKIFGCKCRNLIGPFEKYRGSHLTGIRPSPILILLPELVWNSVIWLVGNNRFWLVISTLKGFISNGLRFRRNCFECFRFGSTQEGFSPFWLAHTLSNQRTLFFHPIRIDFKPVQVQLWHRSLFRDKTKIKMIYWL